MQPRIWRNLVRQGEPIVGKILSKKIIRGKSVSYQISYEYTPILSQPLIRKMTIQRRDYDAVEEGSDTVILYVPARSKRSVIYTLSGYQAV